MTIKEVSRLLGKSPDTIRAGLRLGVYPFGVAFKREGHEKWTYTLFPQKVKEFIYDSED